MVNKIIIAFALILTSTTMAFSQDIYVGARIGALSTHWENTGSLPVLLSRSTRVMTYNLYARQEVSEGLYLGIDLGYIHAPAELHVYQPGRRNPKGNGPLLDLWSIGPSIRKDFSLPDGKIGFQTSLSVHLNYTGFEDYKYSGDEFRIVIRSGDKQPVTDIYVYGDSKVNRRFSVFIRPEVGLFYNLNERGRISVDAMWGINTGGPLVTRDFHEVIYEGQTYTDNYHEYNGQYLAFTIGYEYRIFK